MCTVLFRLHIIAAQLCLIKTILNLSSGETYLIGQIMDNKLYSSWKIEFSMEKKIEKTGTGNS